MHKPGLGMSSRWMDRSWTWPRGLSAGLSDPTRIFRRRERVVWPVNELGERKENITPDPGIFSIRLYMKRCVLPQLLHIRAEAGICYFWLLWGPCRSFFGNFCLPRGVRQTFLLILNPLFGIICVFFYQNIFFSIFLYRHVAAVDQGLRRGRTDGHGIPGVGWEQSMGAVQPLCCDSSGGQGDFRAPRPSSPHMINPNSTRMKVCGKFFAVYKQDWREVWLQGKADKTRKMGRIPCCEWHYNWCWSGDALKSRVMSWTMVGDRKQPAMGMCQYTLSPKMQLSVFLGFVMVGFFFGTAELTRGETTCGFLFS